MVHGRVSVKEISKRWRKWQVGNAVAAQFGLDSPPVIRSIKLLREKVRGGVWCINLTGFQGESDKIVLKVVPAHRNVTEAAIYRHARPLIQSLLPRTFTVRRHHGWLWLFQEYTEPLTGRFTFQPEDFGRIIPVIAAFHARTYRKRFLPPPRELGSAIPVYNSRSYRRVRRDNCLKTIEYLERAMAVRRLRRRIRPYFKPLTRLLRRGPVFFPALERRGACLIHGDLHMHNVCCNRLSDPQWDLRLIDWETARFAPGWFDIIVLVELLMDFRRDWHARAGSIRESCISLYLKSLAQHGISLTGDPLALYKMAYLQRTLETGLRAQLRRELKGGKGELLDRYLYKISAWLPKLRTA